MIGQFLPFVARNFLSEPASEGFEGGREGVFFADLGGALPSILRKTLLRLDKAARHVPLDVRKNVHRLLGFEKLPVCFGRLLRKGELPKPRQKPAFFPLFEGVLPFMTQYEHGVFLCFARTLGRADGITLPFSMTA